MALQLFQSLDSKEDLPSDAFQGLEADVVEANEKLKGIVDSDSCLQTVQTMNRFLRVELPDLERIRTAPPFRTFARKRLNPLLRRIADLDVATLHENDDQLHQVRKLCRRGRYYAEFATPVLGKKVEPAAKYLKTIAGGLGDVRDARWLMQHLEPLGSVSPILQRENDAWKKFSKGWRKFAKLSV